MSNAAAGRRPSRDPWRVRTDGATADRFRARGPWPVERRRQTRVAAPRRAGGSQTPAFGGGFDPTVALQSMSRHPRPAGTDQALVAGKP